MASDEKLSTYTNINIDTFDELKYLENVTPGTASASKAAIVDSSKDIDGINNISLDGQLTYNTTTKGMPLTTLTTAQKSAIASPSVGETVYDTDLKTLNIYDTTWNQLKFDVLSYKLSYFNMGGILPTSTISAGTETGAATGLLIPAYGYAYGENNSYPTQVVLPYDFILDSFVVQVADNTWTGWTTGDSFCWRVEYSTDGTNFSILCSVLFDYDNPTAAYITGDRYRGQWYASGDFPRFVCRFSDMGGTRPAELAANTIVKNYLAWVSGTAVTNSKDCFVVGGFLKTPNVPQSLLN